MSVLRLVARVVLLVLLLPAGLGAQEWGSARTRDLVLRATERRAAAEGAAGVRRWAATARGTVFFLTQLGGDDATPRLVKADELAVEVYWEAPGGSKQTIVAWRDQASLPTDIHYHRDHLGIVTNDFGPLIRIGEGDEVRDVPHPLSPGGLSRYEYGLADSIAVMSAGQRLDVYAIQVRPREAGLPAVIGVMYLDRATAALVRFRFSFTRSSYLEAGLEDITVELENALFGGRHWLPWRQEIEIRRRSGVMDFPVRGIIRGRWRLDDHQVDAEATPRPVVGEAIAGLRAPGGPDSLWEGSLADRVATEIGPIDRLDFVRVRQEIRDIAGARMAGRGPPSRLAFGAVSDLARVNRVEGLRLGVGASMSLGAGVGVLSPWIGIGLANESVTARLAWTVPAGPLGSLRLFAERVVVDMGPTPVISPVVNSVLAQELGADRGSWVERRAAGIGQLRRLSSGLVLTSEAVVERWGSVAVAARPSRGSYRENPPLGDSTVRGVLRLGLARAPGAADGAGGSWWTSGEATMGPSRYARALAGGRWQTSIGTGEASLSGTVGWASRGVPLARSMVFGGWGSLPGERYRAHGGRMMALGRAEYLARIAIPEVSLGTFAGTGSELRVGPFVAAGVAGGAIAGAPWSPSGGARTVAGIALEGVFRLLRVEVGWRLRGGGVGGSVDLTRAWWGVL